MGNQKYLLDLGDLVDLRDLRNLINLIDLRRPELLEELGDPGDLKSLIDERDLINSFYTIITSNGASSSTLLALYCVIVSYRDVPGEVRQRVEQSLQQLEQQSPLLLEPRLLIEAIRRVIGTTALPAPKTVPSPPQRGTADERARALDRLKQHKLLQEANVEELLLACYDAGQVSNETWEALKQYLIRFENFTRRNTVGKLAWGFLREAWSMTPEAWQAVVNHLDDEDALMCGAVVGER